MLYRKTDQSAAYYEVIESQARIVRIVYELYTEQGLSIGAACATSTSNRFRLAQGPRSLGAIDGLGHASQSGWQGHHLFRENGDRTVPAYHAADKALRRCGSSQ
jgi:hypothetical protein